MEEAQGVLKLCDQLKEERNALQEAKVPSVYSLEDIKFTYILLTV